MVNRLQKGAVPPLRNLGGEEGFKDGRLFYLPLAKAAQDYRTAALRRRWRAITHTSCLRLAVTQI